MRKERGERKPLLIITNGLSLSVEETPTLSFKSFFLFAGNAQQHSQRKEEGKGEKSLALAPKKAIEEEENLLSFLHSVSELSFAGGLIENGASLSFPPVGFLGGLNYIEGRERGKKKTSLFLGELEKREDGRSPFSLFWPDCIITIHPNALLENTLD